MTMNTIIPNAERGRQWYALIRPQVETVHHGEFLVIDTRTGEYEVDPDQVVATKRAKKRFDTNENLYTIRVGYQGVARLGAADSYDYRRSRRQP